VPRSLCSVAIATETDATRIFVIECFNDVQVAMDAFTVAFTVTSLRVVGRKSAQHPRPSHR